MKRWKVWTLISLVALLLSLVAGQAAAHPGDGSLQGLFGRVTAIDIVDGDQAVVTLDTKVGPKEVEIVAETQLRVPGMEAPSLDDLASGQFLAIVAEETDGRLVATKVLVKPSEPVVHRHLVGVVTSSEDHQVTLVNVQGTAITLELPVGVEGPTPGQLVTAVVQYDPNTRALLAREVRSAQRMIKRLKERLEQAREEERQRLVEHLKGIIRTATMRHLSVLADVAQRVSPQAQLVLQQVLAAARQRHQQTLESLGLPPPAMEISGYILLRDVSRKSITVVPQKGQPIELIIGDVTKIMVEGEPATFEQLALGQWVKVQYDVTSFEAGMVKVIKRELRGEGLKALLERAIRGEIEGRVVQIDTRAAPPTVVIALGAGRRLTLAVSEDTDIFVSDQGVSLTSLPLNAPVKVRYNPDTGEALEITTVVTLPGQSYVFGVVSGLVKKSRLITVTSPEGKSVTVPISERALIWRDGQRVTIAEVRLGDLVRPTTRYNSRTGEVQVLVLRSPEPVFVEGTVSGKFTTPEGDNYLTIFTPRLAMLTLRVPGIATLQRDGQPVTFEDIRIGDKVTEGWYKLTPAYDELLMEAISLSLQSPSVIRVRGTITALDPSARTLTVRSPDGANFILSVSLTAEVQKDGLKGFGLTNLEVGDTVVSAVYKPATGEVLRLIVLSPDTQVLRGTIRGVDVPLSQVTVETDDQELVLQATVTTVIVKDGREVSLSNLSEKDKVMAAFYKADGTVSRLVVKSPNVMSVRAQGLSVAGLSR